MRDNHHVLHLAQAGSCILRDSGGQHWTVTDQAYLCEVVIVDPGSSRGKILCEEICGADEEIITHDFCDLFLIQVPVPQVLPVCVLQQTKQALSHLNEEMPCITDGMGRSSHFDGLSKKWCDPKLDRKHYWTDI